MDYNYHTHTHFCGHATGAAEAYILRAMENGIRFLGFSDHCPLLFEGDQESLSARVPIREVEGYIKSLRGLREKYKDRMEIVIGFEMEYYPGWFEEMLQNAKDWGAEYLILGQHYTKPEIPDGVYTATPTENVSLLKEYTDSLMEAMKTDVFTYVAHPDIFRFTGEKQIYQKTMEEVCRTSKETGVPLEVNFLGIRDHRHYPNPWFWEVAGRVGCPVTFGFDAHCPWDAYDGESFFAAMKMVEIYGLNYIGRPTLRSIGE